MGTPTQAFSGNPGFVGFNPPPSQAAVANFGPDFPPTYTRNARNAKPPGPKGTNVYEDMEQVAGMDPTLMGGPGNLDQGVPTGLLKV